MPDAENLAVPEFGGDDETMTNDQAAEPEQERDEDTSKDDEQS